MTQKTQNWYSEFLIDPSFQGVNRPFVLSFEDSGDWESYKQNLFLTVGIRDYNLVIDGRNFFDQPVENNFRRYDNIFCISK